MWYHYKRNDYFRSLEIWLFTCFFVAKEKRKKKLQKAKPPPHKKLITLLLLVAHVINSLELGTVLYNDVIFSIVAFCFLVEFYLHAFFNTIYYNPGHARWSHNPHAIEYLASHSISHFQFTFQVTKICRMFLVFFLLCATCIFTSIMYIGQSSRKREITVGKAEALVLTFTHPVIKQFNIKLLCAQRVFFKAFACWEHDYFNAISSLLFWKLKINTGFIYLNFSLFTHIPLIKYLWYIQQCF